jgi:V/A-type H+-transporting ATPase subunit K
MVGERHLNLCGLWIPIKKIQNSDKKLKKRGIMDLSLLGPGLSLSLSIIGCCIGCGIAGAASHAVMSRVEEGHGKYLGMSAAPSSIMIYGFLLMYLMKNAIQAGSLSPTAGIVVGLGAGLSFLFAATIMGQICATGIQSSAKQPAIYGKCWASIGIIESFALFAFVFSWLLML